MGQRTVGALPMLFSPSYSMSPFSLSCLSTFEGWTSRTVERVTWNTTERTASENAAGLSVVPQCIKAAALSGVSHCSSAAAVPWLQGRSTDEGKKIGWRGEGDSWGIADSVLSVVFHVTFLAALPVHPARVDSQGSEKGDMEDNGENGICASVHQSGYPFGCVALQQRGRRCLTLCGTYTNQ